MGSKKKLLWWLKIDVQAIMTSPDCNAMSADQFGAYHWLLYASWMSEDCSVPADDDSLARLSRLGADWATQGALVRSKFYEKDGRLYNEKLLDARAEAIGISDKNRKAAQERWRREAKKSTIRDANAYANGYANAYTNADADAMPADMRRECHITPNTSHITSDRSSPKGRGGAPQSISDIGVDSIPDLPVSRQRLLELVGTESAESWGPLYDWAFDHVPGTASELVSIMNSCQDAEARERKGLSEIEKPGPWFVSMLESRCNDMGLEVPRIAELRKEAG